MNLSQFLTPEIKQQIDAFASRLAKLEGKVKIGTDSVGNPETKSLLHLLLEMKQQLFDLKMQSLIQGAGLVSALEVVQGLDPTLLLPGSTFHTAFAAIFEANLSKLAELEKAQSPIIQPGPTTNGRLKGFL